MSSLLHRFLTAHRLMPALALSLALINVAACGDDDEADGGSDAASDSTPDTTEDTAEDVREFMDFPPVERAEPGVVPETEQREGDPEAGYDTLVNYGYVSCGIPKNAFDQVFGPSAPGIPGRTGDNATLPYIFTASETDTGVKVVAPNCLVCHVGNTPNGLMVGLGNAFADFTVSTAALAPLVRGFIDSSNEAELAEYEDWAMRVQDTGPHIIAPIRGVNTADNLAAAIFAFRNPDTFEWLEEPQYEIPEHIVPIDTPPWWRVRKKNGLYYGGNGRGDHARLMMTASTLCTDSREEAEEIDRRFVDVAAYLRTIEPPAWPYEIDEAQAAEGEEIFNERCSTCHGTYAEDEADETYPNLLISLDEVGTDPLYTNGGAFNYDANLFYFEQSFWGENADIIPADGYVAPPLDGIWATAPFLHNASIPTLEALLDSSKRLTYWSRSFEVYEFDTEAVGFVHTDHPDGPESVPQDMRANVYDTTRLGYSNAGHTFGDSLSNSERAAVIEYLKTL